MRRRSTRYSQDRLCTNPTISDWDDAPGIAVSGYTVYCGDDPESYATGFIASSYDLADWTARKYGDCRAAKHIENHPGVAGYVVSVDAATKGRGVGSAMMEKLLDAMEHDGASRIYLHAVPLGGFMTMPELVRFYEKHRFETAPTSYNKRTYTFMARR